MNTAKVVAFVVAWKTLEVIVGAVLLYGIIKLALALSVSVWATTIVATLLAVKWAVLIAGRGERAQSEGGR